MKSKKTLVFGASTNPSRYSNLAIERLVANGHEVKAFGIKEGTVHGVKIDTEPKAYDGIDTVTLYINPKRQKDYYDHIISLQPKRIIFNPGTENLEFFEKLKKEDIHYEVACNLVMLSTNQY